MTFGQPTFILIGLLAVPVMIAVFPWTAYQRRAALNKIGDPDLINRLSAGVNWRGRRWQAGLWLVAFALVMVALTRPQWGEVTQTIDQEGVQVMVALDVSQSMLVEDVSPNRLTRAKMEIADLMQKLDGDELGLVVFSGASFIQFPLTSDYGTARSFLDNARPGIISRQGTAIGDAIRTSMTGFDENSAAQKVLVIVTDGEDGETDPVAAAQEAADEDIIIYTIGFGSPEGDPIPEFDSRGNVTGYKTDDNGETVLSKLDEVTLREIADIGNGQYFRATASGSELDALVAELNLLQTGAIDSRDTVTRTERFQIFLGGAVLLLIVVELIPDRVRPAGDRQNSPQAVSGHLAKTAPQGEGVTQ